MAKPYYWLEAAAIIVIMMFLVSMLGHCSTQPRPNSLGVLQIYDSPWAYMIGSPARTSLFQRDGHYYTNVEFKPFGASMLNTAPILLCGDQRAYFKANKLLAVTYRISASRNYQGIGCHELLPGDNGVISLEEE